MLLGLTTIGCQSALFTFAYLLKGRDEPPKYDILSKGDIRVAVVPRSSYSNIYELQNAPQEIARQVSLLLEANVKNKKLRVVEQSKIETWLSNRNNNFDTFAEVGKDASIKADIVIGFDIISFQTRDPRDPYLLQGKCQVHVQAIECATGKVLASENLPIIDPPSMPVAVSNPRSEAQFRMQFIGVVSQKIAALFHHHDPHQIRRIDADNLEMHRY